MAKTQVQFHKYPNTRVIRIFHSATYIIAEPGYTLSHYRYHNTFKAIIEVSPGRGDPIYARNLGW